MVKILIVDDEIDARDFLMRGLERHGFAVTSAADGEEACALLDGSFAVVITDLLMPRLDGIGLLKRIPQLNPGALRVVITSFADKDREVAVLNLGAHYLVEKPFTAQQLAEVINRLLADQEQNLGVEHICQRRLAALALSERERQLMVYLLKGLANKEIGGLMGLGEQSVKNALHQLYRKLGVGSRSELFHLIFPT